MKDEGLNASPLKYGKNAGIPYAEVGGFNVHFRIQFGDSYIQYNPASIHYGGVPYYKVSSGNAFSYTGKITGTKNFI